MEQVTVTWDLVAVDGLSLNTAASPLAPVETGVSMSLPLSSLPLKRFIQNTSLHGGFFQAHLYPAVMSVNWVPPPPNQSCQQQRRGAWIAFTPGHRGRGCACQPPSSPQHPQCPPHACFFLFCLPWDLATEHHPPLPLSLLVILTPLGHVLGTAPAQAMNTSFWKRVRRSWALGADLGISPRSFISQLGARGGRC